MPCSARYVGGGCCGGCVGASGCGCREREGCGQGGEAAREGVHTVVSLWFIVVNERLSAATGVSRVPCGCRLSAVLSDVVRVLRACPPCADACEDTGGALVAAVFVAAPRVGAGVGEGEDCHFLAEVFADGAFSLVYDALVLVVEV